jgi:hypothetical protein
LYSARPSGSNLLNGSGVKAFTAAGKNGAIDCLNRKFGSDCATYPN